MSRPKYSAGWYVGEAPWAIRSLARPIALATTGLLLPSSGAVAFAREQLTHTSIVMEAVPVTNAVALERPAPATPVPSVAKLKESTFTPNPKETAKPKVVETAKPKAVETPKSVTPKVTSPATTKPVPSAPVEAPAPDSYPVPVGLSGDVLAARVVASVINHLWPGLTYGGYRAGDQDHGTGRAVDVMVSGAKGWDIAYFVQKNAAKYHIHYIIYQQRIWNVERASEGWRLMEDRGSTTQNHFDHVHISVY